MTAWAVTALPFLFQLLRDGGIQVAEFNPINPLKARGKWRLAKSDHRKILIVDGQVAFTGGVNISQVYSSGFSGGENTTRPKSPGGILTFKLKGRQWRSSKNFLWTPGRDSKGQNSPNGTTSPILKKKRVIPGGGGRQQSGRGQQAYFHSVCVRHHFCTEFALYDQCLFCPRPPDRRCPHGCG